MTAITVQRAKLRSAPRCPRVTEAMLVFLLSNEPSRVLLAFAFFSRRHFDYQMMRYGDCLILTGWGQIRTPYLSERSINCVIIDFSFDFQAIGQRTPPQLIRPKNIQANDLSHPSRKLSGRTAVCGFCETAAVYKSSESLTKQNQIIRFASTWAKNLCRHCSTPERIKVLNFLFSSNWLC